MQTNRQKVSFQIDDMWFENELNLKDLYKEVHSGHTGYGASANILIKEMLVNLLDLARQGGIEVDKPFVITDYGCGQSKAANVLAMVVAENAYEIAELLKNGESYGEILDFLQPTIELADEIQLSELKQIEEYGHITVQRFDIGIPQFSAPLTRKADVLFCNDVFEHIPTEELPAFIGDLEQSGTNIVASISLRDAVNYSKIDTEVLLKGAQKVDNPSGIILNEESGYYIFSLHVSIFPPEVWQEILGPKWTLLSAQDYTACSALNYQPSREYQQYKKELIAKVGFADFIPFPVKLGSKYQNDPVLFRRTAIMQPQKHLYKLNVLREYPESAFKEKERESSESFLIFLGAKLLQDEYTGAYKELELPDKWLEKLYALEALSKINATTDKEVAENARELIAEYNSGNTEKINNYSDYM